MGIFSYVNFTFLYAGNFFSPWDWPLASPSWFVFLFFVLLDIMASASHDDHLPFPDLDEANIEQIVRSSSSATGTAGRKFSVTTRPLSPELRSFSSTQGHLFLKKKDVYAYLPSLHPYPLIRGPALDEVNGADVTPFDIYRIPKPGHHPKGLGGVVFDLPVGVQHQTPLSLEILGKGKELIVETWPPANDDSGNVMADLLPPDSYQEFMEMERIPDDLPDVDNTPPPVISADVSTSLGDLLDKMRGDQDVEDGIEFFDGEEVFSVDDRGINFPPTIGVSLPPFSLEEFVPSYLKIDGYVAFTPRSFDVRNNGAIRFLIVNRPRGTSEWVIPEWNVASRVINAVQNECYDNNMSCLRAFHWANSWRGVGLISLYSSDEFAGAL